MSYADKEEHWELGEELAAVFLLISGEEGPKRWLSRSEHLMLSPKTQIWILAPYQVAQHPPVTPALAVGGLASFFLEHMDSCAQTHMQSHTYT